MSSSSSSQQHNSNYIMIAQKRYFLFSICLLLATIILTIETQQTLAFIQEGLPPKLVDIKSDFTHLEGSNITIVCSISSGNTENLSFDWLKDDIVLNGHENSLLQSSRLRIDVLPNKEHSTLKILNLNEDDAAKYTCLAKNQFGQDKVTTRIKVKGEIGYRRLITTIFIR